MGTSGTGDGQVIGEILSDALLDSLPRGVVAVGPDRRIIHVNAAAERLFGRAHAGVVGEPVDALLPDGYDAAYAAVVHEPPVAGNGAPARAPARLRGVHRDGTPIPLAAALAPFETGSGTGVVVLLEVSGAALGLDPPAVRLAVLEAGVEASDDAIFSHDPDTRIASWNRSAERIFGYPAAEAVGRLTAMLFPDHLQPDIVVLLDTVLAGDRVHHFETEARRKDGMQLPISLSISPVVDGAGRTAGSVLIARDITEQRVAQATLAEIESLPARPKRACIRARGCGTWAVASSSGPTSSTASTTSTRWSSRGRSTPTSRSCTPTTAIGSAPRSSRPSRPAARSTTSTASCGSTARRAGSTRPSSRRTAPTAP